MMMMMMMNINLFVLINRFQYCRCLENFIIENLYSVHVIQVHCKFIHRCRLKTVDRLSCFQRFQSVASFLYND